MLAIISLCPLPVEDIGINCMFRDLYFYFSVFFVPFVAIYFCGLCGG